MKVVYALAVGVLAAAVAGPGRADDDKKDGKKDYAKQIVGKWEITKAGGGAQAGSVLEFLKDGKLKMVLVLGDGKVPSAGTYKVEKDKLSAKFKVGDDGPELDESYTITKLTADALEIEDEKGGVDVMKRVKEKPDGKKDDK